MYKTGEDAAAFYPEDVHIQAHLQSLVEEELRKLIILKNPGIHIEGIGKYVSTRVCKIGTTESTV